MKIYDKIIDVEIPKYLEDIIDNNINDSNINENLNLIYQKYFERHKEEPVYNQSCCLSFGDLDFLLKLINNYYEKICQQKNNDKIKRFS